MAISKDKVRLTISIDKNLRDELEEYANRDRRTMSNQIGYIIEEYLKQQKENNK